MDYVFAKVGQFLEENVIGTVELIFYDYICVGDRRQLIYVHTNFAWHLNVGNSWQNM